MPGHFEIVMKYRAYVSGAVVGLFLRDLILFSSHFAKKQRKITKATIFRDYRTKCISLHLDISGVIFFLLLKEWLFFFVKGTWFDTQCW